jgi:hypothetical protein
MLISPGGFEISGSLWAKSLSEGLLLCGVCAYCRWQEDELEEMNFGPWHVDCFKGLAQYAQQSFKPLAIAIIQFNLFS